MEKDGLEHHGSGAPSTHFSSSTPFRTADPTRRIPVLGPEGDDTIRHINAILHVFRRHSSPCYSADVFTSLSALVEQCRSLMAEAKAASELPQPSHDFFFWLDIHGLPERWERDDLDLLCQVWSLSPVVVDRLSQGCQLAAADVAVEESASRVEGLAASVGILLEGVLQYGSDADRADELSLGHAYGGRMPYLYVPLGTLSGAPVPCSYGNPMGGLESEESSSRGLVMLSGGNQDDTVLPVLCCTHLIAYPTGCITWCPGSSRSYSSSPATSPLSSWKPPPEGSSCETPFQYYSSLSNASSGSGGRQREVLQWRRLEMSAALRFQAMIDDARGVSPSLPASTGALPYRLHTCSFVGSILLPTVCYAFLPNTTDLLGRVDSMDSMLPMIAPEFESDQVDASRRLLALRRRLSVHRRFLLMKLQMLERIQRPEVSVFVGSFLSVAPAKLLLSLPSVGEAGEDARVRDTNDREAAPGPVGLPSSIYFPITESIQAVLERLSTAQVILGNTMILYTTSVTNRNNKGSNETDEMGVMLNLVSMVVIPLNLIACHWGMNCYVPWKTYDPSQSLVPFWVIVGLMLSVILGVLSYPFYTFMTRDRMT